MHFMTTAPTKQDSPQDLIKELRMHIRHCGQHFRDANDNSESLFHPDKGFVTAYDIAAVEEVLDRFEATLVNPLKIKGHATSKDRLYSMAQEILENHEDSDVCNFAERVESYLKEHEHDIPVIKEWVF